MYISRENAMQIVGEISGIIKQHVNMMNERGQIIASTDKKRIGSYHAAASRIITEGLDELRVYDDDEYEGSLKGINLPVTLEGRIVGVIGVTGEYEEIGRYGQIIKKMTEILLRENHLSERKALDHRITSRFLLDWLNDDSLEYTAALIARGHRFGIDITLPRRVLVAKVVDFASFRDHVDGQRMIDNINRVVRRITEGVPGSVFIKTESSMVCLISNCDDGQMRLYALDMQASVKSRFGQQLRIGIDEYSPTVRKGYERALKAINASRTAPDGICFYRDITFELFMSDISPASQREFLVRVFNGCPEKEIDEWVRLLQVYYDCGGSLTRASKRLFIHKNTLQYKLNRLRELSGHDPRDISDAALFVLAIRFYENLRGNILPL